MATEKMRQSRNSTKTGCLLPLRLLVLDSWLTILLLHVLVLSWNHRSIVVSAQAWKLVYEEDFSTLTLPADDDVEWFLDNYREGSFDTIMDDPGIWYENDYGQSFTDALNTFNTYRKEYPLGQDGWLTASLSARDWDRDGEIETEPTLKIETINNKKVLTMQVDDHTGGAILRPTRALADEYRIEYKLMMLDFGGKRGGTIEYDNRINGYSADGCKTQHPWGEGSNSPGWTGDASVPYCEWQDVREGRYGYNGFHFLTIVDFDSPAPRNNHFWHYRRKVLMDSFSQHPDRVGDGTGGLVCDANTGEYYAYRDSSFNTINMWVSGLPNTWAPGPGGLAGNKQLFMTSCNGGSATRGVQSAAELQPEVLANEPYTFAIERNATGYTLEASGNFARVGFKTLRFYRPFVVDDEPIWHYNVKVPEYDGRYNNDLRQDNYAFGSNVWENQWPRASAYPDYFVIGDLYTNVYEGKASLTDIKYFETDRSNQDPNSNSQQCTYTILLEFNERVDIGYKFIPHADAFLRLGVNGNLAVYRGHPRDPIDLVWDNGFDGPTDATYSTTIGMDSNLITSRVDRDDNIIDVWHTGTFLPGGFYFFVLVECDDTNARVATFQGHPERGGSAVWDGNDAIRDGPCVDQFLLTENEVLHAGDFRQAEHVYIVQQPNGNLEVRTGSPSNPGPVLWASGVDRGTFFSYYTQLQGDGNFITWAQPPSGNRFVVWKTDTVFPVGAFTVVLECAAKGGGVAVYEGRPDEDGATRVWVEPPFFFFQIPGLVAANDPPPVDRPDVSLRVSPSPTNAPYGTSTESPPTSPATAPTPVSGETRAPPTPLQAAIQSQSAGARKSYWTWFLAVGIFSLLVYMLG